MDWASFSGQIFLRKFTDFLDANYKLDRPLKDSTSSKDFSSQFHWENEDSTKSLQDTILSLKCEIESLRDLLGDKQAEIHDLKGKISIQSSETRPIKMEVAENEFVDNQETASLSQSHNGGEFLEQIGGELDIALGTVDYNLPFNSPSIAKSHESKDTSRNAIECIKWDDRPSCSFNDEKRTPELNTVVKCSHCSFEHYDISSLIKHVRRVHKNAQHHCQLCNKYYTSFATLHRHVVEVHQKVRPFKCDLCSKSFSREIMLKHHNKIVHGNL